jgi:hypothetical protein
MRLLETCNERKEDVGRRVSREMLRTSREVNRLCALRARAHFGVALGRMCASVKRGIGAAPFSETLAAA